MNKTADFKNVIVCWEKLSPFWIAQWTNGRGKRMRLSTKVPAKGGNYRGERLSPAQAERRALLVAIQLAQNEEAAYAAHDNTTVRQLCSAMLSGKLGRVSANTYANAKTPFAHRARRG